MRYSFGLSLPSAFQFTPLREGRRCIFAQTKMSFLFQFTPLREGRRCIFAQTKMSFLFQFTPLREGRRCRCSVCQRPPSISIHAPPRGATCWKRKPTSTARNFNSRPSARGDASRADLSADGILFQFTPLREGRLLRGKYAQGVHNFNSRPSARGDH